MKRLLLLLLSLSFPAIVIAQEMVSDSHLQKRVSDNYTLEYRNSLELSISMFRTDFEYIVDKKIFVMYEEGYQCPSIDDDIRELGTDYPSFGLSYSYRFSKKFSLEIEGAYSLYKDNFYNRYTNDFIKSTSKNLFFILPTAKLHWLNKKHLSLYSSFGLGLMFMNTVNREGSVKYSEFKVKEAISFTYIGATFGRRLYGLFELGNSYLGDLRFGIGYKF